MEPALGADGKQITVTIDTRTGQLLAKVWLMHVGRVQLYLLDCDVEGNSPRRSRADQPALRRRSSHPHSPGAGARRRRRQGAGGAGHHAGRVPPERRPQRVRHARSDSRADARRRPELRRTPCAKSPSTPSSPRTRRCRPATTASTADLIEEHLGPLRDQLRHLATSN